MTRCLPRRTGRIRAAARRFALVWALGGALAGCSASRSRVLAPEELPLAALEASREELVADLVETSRAVNTLTATVDMTVSGGGLTTGVLREYRETRGALVVDRPSHIRMKGQAPLGLATVFDMVSDGDSFRVSVPVQNKFIMGDTHVQTRAENAVLNLRPHHIMESLFIDVQEYLDDPDVAVALEQAREGRRSFYVFNFVEVGGPTARMLEKVWIDRLDLRVVRKQLFGEDGAVETDVTYGNYEEVDGVLFPQNILIQRPVEDYSLQLTFLNTDLNPELAENTFELPAPPGAELIQVVESNRERLQP